MGLAMSRSIGDFECKRYGVIPDPEVQKFSMNPAEGDGDGDLFVIVASDGVWEFIETQVRRQGPAAGSRRAEASSRPASADPPTQIALSAGSPLWDCGIRRGIGNRRAAAAVGRSVQSWSPGSMTRRTRVSYWCRRPLTGGGDSKARTVMTSPRSSPVSRSWASRHRRLRRRRPAHGSSTRRARC